MNEAGIDLIKKQEGCRLKAYPDPASARGKKLSSSGKDDSTLDGAPWTIGWGHTGDVREGQVISQHQADVVLESDIEYFEGRVLKICPGANANQLAAMTSLAFNIGIAAFETSHVARDFNECDLKGAAIAFGNWRCAGGEVNADLVQRRAAEAALFKAPV